MNEKLQFSWGHIFAFLALIAVSYFTFVGLTYMTDGNFTTGLIGMVVVDIVFIVFFIGAQQMKASGEYIERKIFFERVFIFGSPVVFILGMIPTSHFWTVHAQDEEVVKTFTSSIDNSKKMFDDYEAYANQRIAAYESALDAVIADHSVKKTNGSSVGGRDNSFKADKRNKVPSWGVNDSPSKADKKKNVSLSAEDLYGKLGFNSDIAEQQKDNRVEVLRLQLLSDNYYNLKKQALAWIEKANNGASTWNVFLLGNTETIKESINNWQKQLTSFTEKKMTDEETLLGTVTPYESTAAAEVVDGIDGLASIFTTKKAPNASALLTAIVIYLMLIFPYFLQERHTKSIYRLVGNERTIRRKDTRSNKVARSKHKRTLDDDDDDEPKYTGPLNVTEDSDYPTF